MTPAIPDVAGSYASSQPIYAVPEALNPALAPTPVDYSGSNVTVAAPEDPALQQQAFVGGIAPWVRDQAGRYLA